ncbi:MAG TPA: 50S ribosomal protein L32 [Candidatus Dormibacteraeota bacterium]|jgi:large subunit ribosomal protein L32|nr:50S ribosomal protein L32 [Candidatus Dormibacteraeota bacterium]
MSSQVPKVKLSRSRTRRRRAHQALVPETLHPCPHCKKPCRPHHICLNCGFYGGREVLETE